MKKPGRGRASSIEPGAGRAAIGFPRDQADALAAGAFAFFDEECLCDDFFEDDFSDFIEEEPLVDGVAVADGVDDVEGVDDVWALAAKATVEASTAAIRFFIMVGFFLQERG